MNDCFIYVLAFVNAGKQGKFKDKKGLLRSSRRPAKAFRGWFLCFRRPTASFRTPTIDIPVVSFVIPAVSKPFRTLTMAVPKPTISFPKGTTGFPSICYESSGLFRAFLRHIFVKGGFAYNNISDTIWNRLFTLFYSKDCFIHPGRIIQIELISNAGEIPVNP